MHLAGGLRAVAAASGGRYNYGGESREPLGTSEGGMDEQE